MSGFGLTVNPRTGASAHPAEVQSAVVQVGERGNCRAWWGVRGGQICAVGSKAVDSPAGSAALVADSCNGDSGGGLTATNFDGREVGVETGRVN